MRIYQLSIKEMGCINCIKAVTKAISSTAIVNDINVSIGLASFSSSSAIDRCAIITAIDAAGFEATFIV